MAIGCVADWCSYHAGSRSSGYASRASRWGAAVKRSATHWITILRHPRCGTPLTRPVCLRLRCCFVMTPLLLVQHALVAELSTGACYCYACDEFVADARLDGLQQLLRPPVVREHDGATATPRGTHGLRCARAL